MLSFKGKRVLVTGAARGIGRDLVIGLAKRGADVVALSKSEDRLASLKNELGGVITTITVDITDSNKVRELVQEYGPYHCLVNNAGITQLQPFVEVTEDAFDVLFDTNVKAPIVIGQIVVKGMLENKIKGSVVNVSSLASKIGLQDHTVYCGTKAALDGVTRVMALELGKYGIRTNSVNPTIVMTDMGKLAWSDKTKAKGMMDRIPLGKFLDTEDVVNAIIFLLSDEAAMINGVILPVEGGFLAG